MHTDTLTLRKLCDLACVTSRTVHYYIQQGLLPRAGTHGPGAKYERRHLVRLQMVKRLQREHLPLAVIRDRLQALSDAEVEQTLAEASTATAAGGADSALDQVRKLLSGDKSVPRAQRPTRRANAVSPAARSSPALSVRSRWERIALTPDVELHIRRPLSRERNRQVERLIDKVRRIMTHGSFAAQRTRSSSGSECDHPGAR